MADHSDADFGRDLVLPLRPYRWIILALCLLVWLTSFLVRLGLASAAGQIGTSFASTTTVLSVLVTAFYVGYVACNVFGGVILDRFGGRAIVTSTLLLLAAATFAFSFAETLFVGAGVQVVMGLAAGLYFAALTKIVAEWFPPKERGVAFAVVSMGASLGVMLTNAIYPSVLKTHAWPVLYECLGGYVLLVAVLALALLRNGPGAVSLARSAALPLKSTLALFLRDRNFLLFAVAGFGANWGTWGFAFWANVLMIRGRGIDPVQAGSISALFGLGALIAKPIFGYLSDFLAGRRKVMAIGCFVGFIALLLVFGQLHSVTAFRLSAPILGIFAFVYAPVMNAMLTEIVDSRIVGTGSGLVNAFWQSGNIVAPPVIGLVFTATHSFALALAALSMGPLLGAVCMALLNERHRLSLIGVVPVGVETGQRSGSPNVR